MTSPPVRKKISPAVLADPVLSPNRAEGVLPLSSLRKKVYILGAGATKYILPEKVDDEYEVWSCNGLWRCGYDRHGHWRADRWFEMHPRFAQSYEDLEYLKVAPVPVYVLQTPCSWVKNPFLYPRKEIEKRGARAAYSSTFAYQVALALQLRMEEIILDGCWFVEGREAVIEKPNLAYWIGLAEGSGVRVATTLPLIDQPYCYGYDYDAEKAWAELRCRELLPSIARDGYRGSR